MFNAKRLNKKQERIQQIKREINESCKLAKFKVDCRSWFYIDELESFKLTGKTVIITYFHYDDECCKCYSDSLLDAVMTGFSNHLRPVSINNIEFDKDVNSCNDNAKYTFNFIPKYYETIITHPERAKLEMLLESLDVNNIKLVETMLEGGV